MEEVPRSSKKKHKKISAARWVLRTFMVTLVISMTLDFASTKAMENVGFIVALVILAMFIVVNILFDTIGMAVTAADEKPFNAMASRRVAGAKEALALIKNADRVSSMCNDVIGDISGIISGSTGAAVTVMLIGDLGASALVISLFVTGIVSALTVGGKAIGKLVAISHSTDIVHFVGRCIYFLKMIRLPRRKG